MASKERELVPDIECGGTITEEEGSKDAMPMSSRGKRMLTRVCSGVLNFTGLVSDDSEVDSSDGFPKSTDGSGNMVDVAIDRRARGEDTRDVVPLLDRRNPNDKRKKPTSKKAGKPPRPPKGPELTDADLLLVKELSELAAKKRARIEKMKEFRKMKEAKKTPSSSNLAAMVITILFFVILILQGVFCRTNISRKALGSPAPAVAMVGEDLISAQLFNNAPTNELSGPGLVPMPLESWDNAFSSSPREQDGRDIG